MTEKEMEEKRKEDSKKIQQYTKYLEEALKRKGSKQFDQETLEVVEKVIMMNTFHYTMWNYRKAILSHLFSLQQ